MKQVKCVSCDGHYILRDSKFGIFAGCSNYPQCKSTIKFYDLILRFIYTYGVGIYKWEKECYKCGKKTPVYSYYLSYELAEMDYYFQGGCAEVGIGDIAYFDQILESQYPTIRTQFSKTTNISYMANTCIYCNALQGKNYVVSDPHEIIGELWHNRDMEKYRIGTIRCHDTKLIENDIRRIYLDG